MFEGYYAEHIIRHRERETARVLSLRGMSRRTIPEEERAVLSTDYSGWSWRRFGSVLGTVAVALGVSVALPASLQGLAWSLGQILGLIVR